MPDGWGYVNKYLQPPVLVISLGTLGEVAAPVPLLPSGHHKQENQGYL